ncbi:MAG: DUF3465 domain-containing protein [Planctomycetota bacterium]
MSETQMPKTTLKGLLALVGAAVLALIAKFTGVDLSALTGGSADAGSTDVAEAPAEPGGAAADPAPSAGSQPGAPPKSTPPASEEPAANLPGEPARAKSNRDDTNEIRKLFRANRSDVIVEAEGEVVHLLPDDTRGSQHQLFLVELTNGITLKLSHNIDLAPRIDALRKGDSIRFHGEYEWNAKGGVVHWTHKAKGNSSHEHGWIEHEGRRYW